MCLTHPKTESSRYGGGELTGTGKDLEPTATGTGCFSRDTSTTSLTKNQWFGNDWEMANNRGIGQ